MGGTDIEKLDPIVLRRRVGLVFQVPMILEGSVRDNLLYGMDHSDVDVYTALSRAGLDASYLEQTASTLSVGEGQRVSIARAFVREPEVYSWTNLRRLST